MGTPRSWGHGKSGWLQNSTYHSVHKCSAATTRMPTYSLWQQDVTPAGASVSYGGRAFAHSISRAYGRPSACTTEGTAALQPQSNSSTVFISLSDSSKSNTSMFAAMRDGVTDLGMQHTPRCSCHRRITWAVVLPCRVAISARAGSSSSPFPIDVQDGPPSGE